LLLVLKAELTNAFIYTRRYFFQTTVNLVLTYSFLAGLYLMVTRISSVSQVEDVVRYVNVSQYILRFLGWTFASMAIGFFAQTIRSSAETGVLEQICMSPHGLVVNFIARAISSVMLQFINVFILFFVIVRTREVTHVALRLQVLPSLFVLIVSLASVYGVGFIFGGFALVFKRIGQVTMIFRMVYFMLAMIPIGVMPVYMQMVAKGVPFIHGLDLLRRLNVPGVDYTSFGELLTLNEVGSLCLNAAVWFTLGVCFFKFMETRARLSGGLGAY